MIATAGGFPLGAHLWRADGGTGESRPVTVVAPATSVACRYYAPFAEYLCHQGRDVVTFDYRGVGESAPSTLRGFDAGWLDWARDLDAVLAHVRTAMPGRPIDIVAHSVGGCLLGMAPTAAHVRRIFTVGAQYAYWRDYAPWARRGMIFRWHVLMPLLVSAFGYMPAKRFGWMEDTPRGVARDWYRMGARFEQRLASGQAARSRLVAGFKSVTAPILAVAMTDDAFATAPAVERLLAYFTASERIHLRIDPPALGMDGVGHFAFFNQRFSSLLWPIALEWLDHQTVRATRAHGRHGPTQGDGLELVRMPAR